MKKRIVITGIGVVTPIGIGKDVFADALHKGVSGANPIATFDVTAFSTRFAAHVKDFNVEQYIDRKKANHTALAEVATPDANDNTWLFVWKTGEKKLVSGLPVELDYKPKGEIIT
jgi:3-oxoacyl-(acyl-carrier-protein) synthase